MLKIKSILFTLLKEKLLDYSKTQTYRLLFIPTYDIGETVKIDFKENDKRETLFLAEIKDIYPKQIKNLTLTEAVRDGFKTIREFRDKVMKINKIKNWNRWGFVIRFKPIKNLNSRLW